VCVLQVIAAVSNNQTLKMPPNVHFHASDWIDEAHVPTTSPLKAETSPVGQRLWQKRKQLREEQEDPEDEDCDRCCWQALKSIKILHDDEGEECRDWLDAFGGTLYFIPDHVLQEDVPSPARFTAKVADFNDNLYYAMQTKKGLDHLGSLQDLEALVPANEHLASFLSTESTIPQPAHVDYSWDILASTKDLQVGFAPLTEDGMFLQVWPTAPQETTTVPGQIIYIPFGKLLVLPASTIHGGGFRTAHHGNLRFHLYLAQNESKLPDYQTNKYTEPHDKGSELCDRYVDAPFMQELLDYLFI
jgi:hypothetical protein